VLFLVLRRELSPLLLGVLGAKIVAPRLKPAPQAIKVLKNDKSAAQPVELRRLAARIAHPPFHVLSSRISRLLSGIYDPRVLSQRHPKEMFCAMGSIIGLLLR